MLYYVVLFCIYNIPLFAILSYLETAIFWYLDNCKGMLLKVAKIALKMGSFGNAKNASVLPVMVLL